MQSSILNTEDITMLFFQFPCDWYRCYYGLVSLRSVSELWMYKRMGLKLLLNIIYEYIYVLHNKTYIEKRLLCKAVVLTSKWPRTPSGLTSMIVFRKIWSIFEELPVQFLKFRYLNAVMGLISIDCSSVSLISVSTVNHAYYSYRYQLDCFGAVILDIRLY